MFDFNFKARVLIGWLVQTPEYSLASQSERVPASQAFEFLRWSAFLTASIYKVLEFEICSYSVYLFHKNNISSLEKNDLTVDQS